jgi:hypothetical protein
VRRLFAAAAGLTAAVLVAGCQSNGYLPNGAYSGSTSQDTAVNVNVSDGGVTLDGITMQRRTDGWLQGQHHKQIRMKCRTAFHGDELFCDISRNGQLETDELMKV